MHSAIVQGRHIGFAQCSRTRALVEHQQEPSPDYRVVTSLCLRPWSNAAKEPRKQPASRVEITAAGGRFCGDYAQRWKQKDGE